jgi:hypothetical protein
MILLPTVSFIVGTTGMNHYVQLFDLANFLPMLVLKLLSSQYPPPDSESHTWPKIFVKLQKWKLIVAAKYDKHAY